MVFNAFRIFRMTNVTKGNDASQLNQAQCDLGSSRSS
jgi:hypothetical protein